MSLAAGTRLGPYEIATQLGAGGMGVVYRARDTRLGRDVAVKVLPAHLSANPEIRARFEREAKTVSSLNHPNICTLFDVGREGDTDYLVMELIEGGTLAERLKRGPLPPAEVLRLGVQIADALDRAHRAGIVHRDLKPGNVMLTKSGAKLMDFGLSRVGAMAGSASGSGATQAALTQSPTIAQALTTEGSLLGTFQYMSPEQLEGREADVRSDIWALGCVLYEMVTGRRAFEGRSQASLIAAILERQPAPVGEAPSGAPPSSVVNAPPPGIERLIRNCLAKDPDERIQTAHDVRLQLQGIAETAGVSGTSVVSTTSGIGPALAMRPRGGTSRLAWSVAVLGMLVGVGAVLWVARRPVASLPAMRFRLGDIPGAVDMFWPRISPDGKYLLVSAIDSAGVVRAFVRPMDQIDLHPLPGTEGVARSYWSPDGREIAFVRDQKIQRVSIAGGSPVTVCAATGSDVSWGSKGLILMDGRFTDSLLVVPAGGGELRPAARIDRAAHEVGSAWPCFLPDGEHFLFVGNMATGREGANIRLGRIGSLDSKLLGKTDGRVEYAPGGWVLFLHGTSLLAQKLDLGAGKLAGQPITLVDQLRLGNASGHFSISNDGILAFASAGEEPSRPLVGMNRQGVVSGPPLATGNVAGPRASPDARRILFLRGRLSVRTGGDVYVRDLDRGTETRLTFSDRFALTPVWSPDGKRFAYVLRSGDASSVVRIDMADGLGASDSIPIPSGTMVSLTGWSADGTRLFGYDVQRGRCFALPLSGATRTPQSLIDTTLSVVQGVVSPDGRWIAGTTGREPDYQIVVFSLTGEPGRWQVSSVPGIMPRWSRNGRELVYEAFPTGRLMAVDIDTKSGFQAGTPHELFTLAGRSFTHEIASWGVDASGEHFYAVAQPSRPRSAGIIELVTRFGDLVSRK